jgi:hypothetical protein
MSEMWLEKPMLDTALWELRKLVLGPSNLVL